MLNAMPAFSWLLAAWMLIVGFSGDALAAEDRKDNPWLILPPGAPVRSGEGTLKQDEGYRDFVGIPLVRASEGDG